MLEIDNFGLPSGQKKDKNVIQKAIELGRNFWANQYLESTIGEADGGFLVGDYAHEMIVEIHTAVSEVIRGK